MPAAVIAQLIIALGPSALGLIKDLVALWSAPSISVDQVNAICDKAKTSYDDYLKAAGKPQ